MVMQVTYAYDYEIDAMISYDVWWMYVLEYSLVA